MTWDVEDAIGAELDAGESLRWAGRPGARETASEHAVSIGAGLLFACINMAQVFPLPERFSGEFRQILSLILPLVFSALGIAATGNAVVEILRAKRTAYAVTDRRVLIVSDFLGHRSMTVAPSAINSVEMKEDGRGGGSVAFRKDTIDTGEGTRTTTLKFIGVRDVGTAAREIRRLMTECPPVILHGGVSQPGRRIDRRPVSTL
ncbi:YdbT family protein [Ensifer soli]|uniref:hypothetical protein n=1 Tax=Ciceribacter sp. sgz301302 TaxID=3342379 RepID=UPI0035B6BC37